MWARRGDGQGRLKGGISKFQAPKKFEIAMTKTRKHKVRAGDFVGIWVLGFENFIYCTPRTKGKI